MTLHPIVPGLLQVPLGPVNAFLLEDDDGLTLIDTGMPGSADRVLAVVQELGRPPADLRRVLLTHAHVDHSGSAAELRRRTGATIAMHPVDAPLVRSGQVLRPMKAAPGLVNALFFRIISATSPITIEPTEVDEEIADGQVLPIAGGLQAIHVPGHCAGQVAFLWHRHGGVLLAADAAANAFGLALSPGYEDLGAGLESLARLSALDFEVACFGHGRPILREAAGRFRRKWPAPAAITRTHR